MIKVVLSGLTGYLIGSIPFSFLLVKMSKGIDLRKFGDGNIGASNAALAAGKKTGTAAFLFDLLKGIIAVYAAKFFFRTNDAGFAFAAIFAVAGHNWPVFLGFKGGKGLSTSMGVIGSLLPIEALILAGPVLLIYFLSKKMIFSLLFVSFFLPIICFIRKESVILAFSVIVILILGYVHGQENLKEAFGFKPQKGKKK